MGVTLYFSNQLMPLAEKLQENLFSTVPDRDLLQPPVVIVPNMNLSKWLKLTLARRQGIFMNVTFDYLETGLWSMLRSLADMEEPEPVLLDRENLRVLLFFILMSSDFDTTEVGLIDRYIPQEKDADGDREIRCWQLADELARLFQEYEYHRTDMVLGWLADRPVEEAMERCQKRLYRDMLALKNDWGQAAGKSICSLLEYAHQRLGGDTAIPIDDGDRKVVHLFGLSQISPFHLHVLAGLQTDFDIRIYSLNPSREYWEDIKTPREKKWVRRQKADHLTLNEEEIRAGELFSPVDHALLSAWGKPGRESIRLLCQLTDYDFQAGFAEPPQPQTVLAAIGYGLLTLNPVADLPYPLHQDTSLQMVACPGIRREVETVYNSILYNLESDPQLCMTDIAVMVTDMARYKPVVDSVFRRLPVRITYNLVDSVARTESVFAQAVLAFIELARGNFSRKQVFELLRNPCVMQRWGYSPETLTTWIGWADALGIFHDYEKPAPTDSDGPPAGRFSWRQGLERLRLSRIMTVADRDDGLGRQHYHGLIPYADIETTDDRLVDKFCRIVEALANCLKPFRENEATARQWRFALFNGLDQFVAISDDMRGEEAVYRSLVQACDNLMRYDELAAIRTNEKLTVEALWAYIQSHLDGISGGQGDYLTGGVTVAALMPMRPIPFRVVYVLGLEEGRFPGPVPQSGFDLRSRRRRIGDINAAERNRYLFLEILLSVGEKLYLSYVSRDLQKDRSLAPCSVLQQLRRYVEQDLLAGNEFRIAQIPIRPDSPDYILPNAITSWSDVLVDSSLAHRISCYRRSGLWSQFLHRSTSGEREDVDRYDPDLTLPEKRPEEQGSGAAQLSTGLLRRFLLDPVAVACRYHLGVEDAVDPRVAMADREDEPFGSPYPLDFIIRTQPLKHWIASQLNGGCSGPSDTLLADAFDAVYGDFSRQSRVPAGDFAIHDKARLQQQVREAAETLYPVVEQMRSARQLFAEVVVGRSLEAGAGADCLRFDPVSFSLDGRHADIPPVVELSGGLPWVWQSSDSSWHCLVVTGSHRKANRADKHVIEPLLTFMALLAGSSPCPWSDCGRLHLHIAYRSGLQHWAYNLMPGSSGDYLAGLLEDFFTSTPLLWLPFDIVFGQKDLRACIARKATDRSDAKAFFLALQDAMQEAADLRTVMAKATLSPDILDRARRRFRVFVPE